MDQTPFNIIQEKLPLIEKEHNVEILYAVESGSRAWGFESTDSDYDVRFIYKHTLEWYLHILPKRDVIEYPIDDLVDYSGWDLRKTLFLLNKSNPVLFEWLQSPVVYYKNEKAYSLLKEVSQHYFSPISTVYHYLHMAAGNYRRYLNGDLVKIKKYFYVLRPVLACLWVERNNEAPPMEFEKLLHYLDLDKTLIDKIEVLLERKKAGEEMGLEPKVDEINRFIEENIAYFEANTKTFDPNKKPDSKVLDEYFLRILRG
jgi:predicted nucleotidyltransferase